MWIRVSSPLPAAARRAPQSIAAAIADPINSAATAFLTGLVPECRVQAIT